MHSVLFDLDGTLWHNTRPPDFEAITRLQAARVAQVLPAAGTEAFVRAFWAEWQRVDRARSPGDLREFDWRETMAATCLALSIDASDIDLRRAWEASNAVPRTAFNTEPVDGAIAMLAALQARGWRSAIVTNFPLEAALLRPHIEACGLGAGIDAIVTSADLGVRKPDARPFLSALDALGSAVGDAVMVGDSLENDVLPALRLGMRAIPRSTEPGPDLEHPHARIRALAELPELLGAATPR